VNDLFLLGAGASVEAGIPDAYAMTKVMVDKFTHSRSYMGFEKVLKFVVGGLFFQKGINGENPYDGVNIEDLFNTIISLGSYQSSELGPFINSWHPHLNQLEGGNIASETSRELLETIYKPLEEYFYESMMSFGQQKQVSFGSRFTPSHIEIAINSDRFKRIFADAVRQVALKSEGKLFAATANAMISSLTNMVWLSDPDKVQYLSPLVRHVRKTNSIIATLNYDNAIELAGRVTKCLVDTGLESWSNTGVFSFDSNTIPLIKIHGSIDWALSNGKTSPQKPLPFQVIKKLNMAGNQEQKLRPAIVFGGKNKLTTKGPFLSLLRTFEKQLSNAETLWVIGYSFRDEHVNEFILNWFNGKTTRIIGIVDPRINRSNPFINHLSNAKQKGRRKRVNIIEEPASIGILEILASHSQS
jgi:NAD-dependent SIR2 family protein deacetylase